MHTPISTLSLSPSLSLFLFLPPSLSFSFSLPLSLLLSYSYRCCDAERSHECVQKWRESSPHVHSGIPGNVIMRYLYLDLKEGHVLINDITWFQVIRLYVSMVTDKSKQIYAHVQTFMTPMKADTPKWKPALALTNRAYNFFVPKSIS